MPQNFKIELKNRRTWKVYYDLMMFTQTGQITSGISKFDVAVSRAVNCDEMKGVGNSIGGTTFEDDAKNGTIFT